MRISDWSSDVCSSDLKDWRWLNASSTAYLHTKAAVLDGQDVIVGSFNMDPRSIDLNTEIALLVRSRRLADAVTAFIDRKSVVSGKSVSVRVDLGGRRIIKKKKQDTHNKI